MRDFRLAQRIVVARQGPLYGREGRVVRLLRRDNSAWVRMDEDLPDSLRQFPRDDERGRDIVLYPGECILAGK